MRLILLPLFALALPSAQLLGQGASPAIPSASDAKTASSLTKEERTKAVEYLEATQKEFHAAIAGLSEAQWKFKPAADRWSVAEVAEHIALAEEMIWGAVNGKIMKSAPAPEKRAEGG